MLKTTEEKYKRLKKWREDNCDEVDEDEFIQRVVKVKKKIDLLEIMEEKYKRLKKWPKDSFVGVSGDEFDERQKIEARYRNFAGLVLPNKNFVVDKKLFSGTLFYPACYDYAIFTGGVTFKGGNSKDENLGIGHQFHGTKFQGEFRFDADCTFGHDFPFASAIIPSGSVFTFGANKKITFKQSKTGSIIKEPFAALNIADGGGFRFFHCSFPEGFTLKSLNLKSSYFQGSHIENIRFINCEFEEKTGPLRTIFADENRQGLTKKDFGELAVMYQLMKKSFEDQKDYQTAGKFYVSEMVFRQKEATGVKKFVLSAYGFLAGYGESVWRTGFFLLFCLLISIALYYFSIDSLIQAKKIIFGYCITLYYFSPDSLIQAAEAAFSNFLLFKKSETIAIDDASSRLFLLFASVASRLLFIISGFLFINAIRRRLRRS